MKEDDHRKDLWLWFGLSYSSWLTLPRAMMHEMPQEWQEKMAELLFQWDETWDTGDTPTPYVVARQGNKFAKWPEWVMNYRHPDKQTIDAHRREKPE
jgi:hypothetical protein